MSPKNRRKGGLSGNPEDDMNEYTRSGPSPSTTNPSPLSMNNSQESSVDQRQNTNQNPNQNWNEMFSWLTTSKNFIIIILFILLVLSFLGVNILLILGAAFQWIVKTFGPFFSTVFSYIGYATGTAINKSADVVANAATTGISIADGSIHSIGNLLKDDSNADVNVAARVKMDNISFDLLPSPTTLASSTPQTLAAPPMITSAIFQNPSLDAILNNGSKSLNPPPSPNMTGTPIQRTNNKGSWCLTGEYNGARGCVEMGSEDVCMSGQIYPSQAECVNIQQEGFSALNPALKSLTPGNLVIAGDVPGIYPNKGPMNVLSISQRVN
jgi:hypothetical protein